jgi:hypothetical protein
MTEQLCIRWKYGGGKGESTASPAFKREHLEAWREALQREYPDGVFSIEVKPSTNIITTTRNLVRELL